MSSLIDNLCQGDRRSLARAMSLADDPGQAGQTLRETLRRSTGQVPWWGFTGPPGVGKSTLIDALLKLLREQKRRVGVVAVDPTSPLSDGALLGDRVRMMRHALDPEVFIRSLATRHCEGGLSDAALHCARLLELARFDPVLIETVGVGQNEVDVASVADVRVVILGPGYGDEIQLIKAGLLEIADIVVVNKCDLSEANRLLKEVHEELGHSTTAQHAEVVGIEANTGRNVDVLLEKLLSLDAAARTPERRAHNQQRRLVGEIRRSVMLTCEQSLERSLADPAGKELIAKLSSGQITLQEAVTHHLSAISKT